MALQTDQRAQTSLAPLSISESGLSFSLGSSGAQDFQVFAGWYCAKFGTPLRIALFKIVRAEMLRQLSQNKLARNTMWMTIGQGVRLVIQALYFVEIARSLGARNYGAFLGVVA